MNTDGLGGRIRIGYFFLTVFILLFAVGCGSEDEEDLTVFQVYYVDKDGYGLVSEEFETRMPGQNMVETIEKLLDQLQSKGKKGNYRNPIQRDVEISDFAIKDTQLSIYFTAAYNSRSGIDEILARAAVVKTLCQVPGIDYVEFYVEDQPLMQSGNAVGLMNPDTFVDELSPEFKEQNKRVTLYFAREGKQELTGVSLEVTYSAAEPLAKLLLENLITVPESVSSLGEKDIISAIPQGTVVNTVTIRDNICYVDLSGEFMELLSNVKSDVTVYSIVNTLCELSSVSKVQFTIDGEPQEKYGDTENFNTPYERNLDIISGLTEVRVNSIENQ